METFHPVFVNKYDPLKAGSIDGTDEYPHDRAIGRALAARYKPNRFVQGDPECTLFIGRLNPLTTEETIRKSFKQFGRIKSVRVVRDIVTGSSKCYAFLEFEDAFIARSAIRGSFEVVIDDHEVLVDSEKARTLKGWVPRRFGGGLGGKRESGQLRFGGKDRPFQKPLLRPEVDKRGSHVAGYFNRGRTKSSEYYNKRDTDRGKSSDRFREKQKKDLSRYLDLIKGK